MSLRKRVSTPRHSLRTVTVTVTGPVTRQGRRGAAETNAAPTVSTSDGRGQLQLEL